MYSDIFSKLYDAFGWNYYPESFAQLLLRWIDEQGLHINNMLGKAELSSYRFSAGKYDRLEA